MGNTRVDDMSRPAKRALLIGIQYKHLSIHGQMLKGAHEDPQMLRDLLIDVYGYDEKDITVLIDDDSRHHVWPTRDNIVAAMKHLVADASPGDRFVFSFSGHGSQITNEDGSEEDGLDETLVTADTEYDPETQKYSSYIKDDDVHALLVDALPAGARMVMIFDCCHSGTAADLNVALTDNLASPCSPISTPHPLRRNSYGFGAVQYSAEDQTQQPWWFTRNGKGRNSSLPMPSLLPDVTSWSACMDSQVTYGGREGGMFMKAFTRILRKTPRQTHAQLQQSLRRKLAKHTSKHTLKKGGDHNLTVTSPRVQVSSLKNSSLYHVPFEM